VAAGRTGLYVRLCSIAGGMAPLAKLLQFSYNGRRLKRRAAARPERPTLASQDRVDAALRALVAANAAARQRSSGASSSYSEPRVPVMPSRRAIRDCCGEEVSEAIELAGGTRAVAARLGWRSDARGRPRGASAG